MRLNKPQIELLSKWANSGRLIVRPILSPDDTPEWAKHEFILARLVSGILMEHSKSGLLEKNSGAKRDRYKNSNRKGWVTRKRQKLARAASRAEAEAGKMEDAA